MNKTFTTALLLLSTHILYAQNYFQPGMVWEQLTFPDEPYYDDIPVKYFLGDYEMVEGREACPMYLEYPESPEKGISLNCYVSTDGNKVYSLCGNEEKSWELMYDFDISTGATNDFWISPHLYCNYYGYGPWAIQCLARHIETTQYGDIEMIQVDYAEKSYSSLTGYWIKGIGASRGVTENCTFGFDGGGGRLIKASFNGRTLYENPMPSQVENLDEIQETPIHYDFQGRKIESPQPGDLLIEVSKSGCKKLIF